MFEFRKERLNSCLFALVWSKRCAPGCGYTMSLLKDAVGNSIRCARHKLKTEQVRLVAAAAGNQFEMNHGNDDDLELMLQDDNEY